MGPLREASEDFLDRVMIRYGICQQIIRVRAPTPVYAIFSPANVTCTRLTEACNDAHHVHEVTAERISVFSGGIERSRVLVCTRDNQRMLTEVPVWIVGEMHLQELEISSA